MEIIKHDKYFTQIDRNVFKPFGQQLMTCYNQFLQHSIDNLPWVNRRFTRQEMKGLEYLLDASMTKTCNELTFPLIRLQQHETTAITKDAFLVDRLMDYMYSYIIEMALLNDGSSRRLPENMRTHRKEYKKMRIQTMQLCKKRHECKKKCPYEWVIYTKKTSDFFTYCQRVMDQNAFISYDDNEHYLNITSVSFYLVNFLCPVTENENEMVSDYDEWVRVPLIFIDLWHQRVI